MEQKAFGGGEFLIVDASHEEVFTPEDFDEDQRLMGKAAEDFSLGEVVPRTDELEDINPELLRRLLKKAADLGLVSLEIPEVYGGAGMDYVSSTLVGEKMHQGVLPFMMLYGMQTSVGTLPLLLFGTPEQKEKYLPIVGNGDMVSTYALTEPQHGSDALGAETTAILSEDGKYYILNGQKQFSTNAGLTDLMSTYAQVDGEKFTAFLVERKWDGISLDAEEDKMGLHGCSTRSIIFQDVKVPVENVLGEVGRGHVVALNALNIGRLKVGVFSTGWMKTLIPEVVKYAKGRIQFGKPICEFGLIRHKIAEMVIRCYVLESMVYRTANLLDNAIGEIDLATEESAKKMEAALREYAIEGSINKVFGSEALDFVADECVQTMGGYGFIRGNLIERSYRDQRIQRIWEGTNEINRMLIVNMLMKVAKKGHLALFDAIKEAGSESGDTGSDKNPDQVLGAQKKILKTAKKAALMVMGLALEKYGDQLEDEQEVLALIADMAIGIFAMESALLRALKNLSKLGEDKSRMHIAAASVFINDTFPRLILMARNIAAATSEGEDLSANLTALTGLDMLLDVNAIALREEIVEKTIPIARYPFAQL